MYLQYRSVVKLCIGAGSLKYQKSLEITQLMETKSIRFRKYPTVIVSNCLTKLGNCLLDLLKCLCDCFIYLFIWGFTSLSTLYISRRVVGRAEETSTYSWSRFCSVNCWPTASNYQVSHLRPCWELNPGLRGGRRECYHSATIAPDCFV